MLQGISIIICSINEKLRDSIISNITETIGVPFEFIIKDNSIEKRGICFVYNECIENARYPFICLVHEDVIIHTINWGEILIKQAEIANTGVIGVSGTRTLSDFPYAWWSFSKSNRINIIQHDKNNEVKDWKIDANHYKDFEEVLVLDGVFLFMKKDVWSKIRFDSDNFPFFHYYDVDFTYQASFEYKNYISTTILVEHFSIGNINNDWFDAALCFVEKWKDTLPTSIDDEYNYSQIQRLNQVSFYWYIRNLVLQSTFGLYKIWGIAIVLNAKMGNANSKVKVYFWLWKFFILKYLLRAYHVLINKRK